MIYADVNPKIQTVHDLARAMIAEFERTGWLQESYGRRNGRKCVEGCARYVLTGDVTGVPRTSDVLKTLVIEIYTRTGKGPIGWNDDESCTFAEILSVLTDIAEGRTP